MTVITTNKPVDKTTLRIVKKGFEEQKGVSVLRIYSENNNIYGIYVADINELLSFYIQPLTNMSTDIDGHNILMIELGLLLHTIYQNGSMQMFNLLHSSGDIELNSDNENFQKLMQLSYDNPPLKISSFHLIEWIDRLNSGDLNMSTIDLLDMVKHFMINEPLDIDVSDESSEAVIKNNLNLVRQELKSRKFEKITEATIVKIDKLFVQLQLDLYTTDDK